jgi:lysosomal Pro-X carboxypeptidase
MCSNITSFLNSKSSTDPIDILRAVYSGVNVYQNFTGQTSCININSDINSDTVNMVSWTYQTCTEFVFPMCSNGKNDMFQPQKWDFKAYSLACYNQFKTAPRSEWPSVNYGVSVEDVKSYSNIIFSNGG